MASVATSDLIGWEEGSAVVREACKFLARARCDCWEVYDERWIDAPVR